ncbi:MAG TPA: substrate-binding domain-containing protein [Streptosporangiaceae bacterium]
MHADSRLRAARQARAYSQQQLADMAGVSRQAIAGVESGLSDPSLRTALALASALGMTVEELFGAATPILPLTARPAVPLGEQGARVTVAPMGEGYVAFPLRGPSASRAGFLPAHGLACGPDGDPGTAREVQPIGPPRLTLIVAGCDPALPLLEAPLALLDPPVSLAWWPCPSREALELAARGLVHVAGTHLRGPARAGGDGPAAGLLPQGGEVIGFCCWREGLVLRPDVAGGVVSVSDVARRKLRLVNREPGAEARRLLDHALSEAGIDAGQLPGYRTQVTGHLQVAAAISAGLADAGIASEPAALAYGLAFVPLAAEQFNLVIPAGQAGSREVQGLRKVLSSAWLLNQLASLPGYDPGPCGEHVTTLAPARVSRPGAAAPAR